MKYAGKSLIALALAALLLGGCGLPTGRDQAAAPAEQNMPDTRAIRSKYIGNILRGSWDPGPTTRARFAEYWNQVTPENSGKWRMVEAQKDKYDFREVTEIYEFAIERGYKFNYHCLLWGRNDSGIPSWLGELPDGSKRIKIFGFMNEVFRRFGKMNAIDVVNEPINDPFDYKDALGGDGKTGWDWVIKAYEVAKKYCKELAPNCKLLINEFGILNCDPNNNQGTRNKYYNLIKILNDKKLLDGIGVQCHSFDIGGNASITRMKANLDKLAEFNLPIYLSEFDISDADDADQKVRLKEVFTALYDHPAVEGVTFWGFVEGEMWDEARYGYLLKSDNTERPALKWLKDQYLNPRNAIVCEKVFTNSGKQYSYLRDSSGGTVNLMVPVSPLSKCQWEFRPYAGHEGVGRFRSTKTGLYLSVDNPSATEPNVISEARNAGANKQRWIIQKQPDGTVRIKNRQCYKYLTAVAPANNKGMPILICTSLKNPVEDSQYWRFQ